MWVINNNCMLSEYVIFVLLKKNVASSLCGLVTKEIIILTNTPKY